MLSALLVGPAKNKRQKHYSDVVDEVYENGQRSTGIVLIQRMIPHCYTILLSSES